MSTALASDPTAPLLGGVHHFLLRRLHSLTGLVFGGYLIVHLVINATIAQRGDVYQRQVNKIHDLPWLPLIEWTFIYIPILFHTVYGAWVIATGRPNNGSYPYGKNWLYLLQRISAVYLVFFMLFHVLSLKYGAFGAGLSFHPHHANETIVRHMHASALLTWVVYPLGVVASAFHTANGFWTAAVTWGVTISANARKRWAAACVGLGVGLFVAGIIAIVAAATQAQQAIPGQ